MECKSELNSYYRQYSQDFPREAESYYLKQAIRYTQIALPFIGLYNPVGKAISLFSGTTRLCTHVYEVKKAENNKRRVYETCQTIFSAAVLLNSVTCSTTGLYFTTALDLATNAYTIGKDLWEQDYEKAGNEALQMTGSVLYAAFLISSSTNVILAFLAYQALLNLWEAKKEWNESKTPETIAKFAMAIIRASQAHSHYSEAYSIKPHPFENLTEKVDQQRCILVDQNGEEFDFGSNFHGFGKGIVKGMNLRFKEKGDFLELDFKVNHVFRKKIDKKIRSLALLSKEEKRGLLVQHQLSNECPRIKIGRRKISKQMPLYKLVLEDVGSIKIGSVSRSTRTSNKNAFIADTQVKVRLKKNMGFQTLKQVLSFVGIQDVVAESSNEDIQRLKIGQIFRLFNPKEASLFERTKKFFSLPLSKLKKRIVKLDPSMQERLTDEALAKVTPREVLPGRVRYGNDGLGEFFQKRGVLNLSAIQSIGEGNKDAFKGIASILKLGMFSSEQRNYGKISKGGLENDHDSVFFQASLRGGDNLTLKGYYSDYGDINILVSPKVLDLFTYQYFRDRFGTRHIGSKSTSGTYLDRPSIFTFVDTLIKHPKKYWGQEVMVKDRVKPEFIIGLETKTQRIKDGLISYLRNHEMIEKDQQGRETIHGVLLDKFIMVAGR